MTTVTESDIKELKDLIIAFREEVNRQITTLSNRISALEIGQAEIKAKLSNLETSSQKIPDLLETNRRNCYDCFYQFYA